MEGVQAQEIMKLIFKMNQISQRYTHANVKDIPKAVTSFKVIALPYYDKARAYVNLNEYRGMYKKL